MLYSLYAVLIAGTLFLAMLLLTEIGRRAGLRRAAADATGSRAGLGAIDAAVFSLLGLLIAFSFSGAAMRFDARRQVAIQETNAIGTAWLRIDQKFPRVGLIRREPVDQLVEDLRQGMNTPG